MKKLILLFLVIFISCSSDDVNQELEKTADNLIGDWQWIAFTSNIPLDYNNDGESSKNLYKQFGEVCRKDDILRFEKRNETSGPYFEIENEQVCNSNDPNTIKRTSNWYFDDNFLRILEDDAANGFGIEEFTTEYLTLSTTVNFQNGEPVIYYYRYQKI